MNKKSDGQKKGVQKKEREKKGYDHFFQGSLLWPHPAVRKGRYIWPLAEHTTQLQRHKVRELLFVLLYSSRKTQKNKAHKSCSQGTDEHITTMAVLEFVTEMYIFERTPIFVVFFTWDHYYCSCCQLDFNPEAHTRGRPVTMLLQATSRMSSATICFCCPVNHASCNSKRMRRKTGVEHPPQSFRLKQGADSTQNK